MLFPGDLVTNLSQFFSEDHIDRGISRVLQCSSLTRDEAVSTIRGHGRGGPLWYRYVLKLPIFISSPGLKFFYASLFHHHLSWHLICEYPLTSSPVTRSLLPPSGPLLHFPFPPAPPESRLRRRLPKVLARRSIFSSPGGRLLL